MSDRDEMAKEAMKELLSHRLRFPLNLNMSNTGFEMEIDAGSIAHQAYQMADAMLYAREQNTHITP